MGRPKYSCRYTSKLKVNADLLKAARAAKEKAAQEETSPNKSKPQSLNGSWNEDEFVLRFSDGSEGCRSQSNTPKSASPQKLNDAVLSEKLTERETIGMRTRSKRTALSVPVSPEVKNQFLSAFVLLEKLSDPSPKKAVQPLKRLSSERTINLVDDFSKRTKRYCFKCTTITTYASSKDNELCHKCNTLLLYHCVKCGGKMSTHSDILGHLEVKCNSRKKREKVAKVL